MTTSALSFFSNAFPGENQMFDGNIYRLDATPKYQVGFRAARADGSIYRYGHFSGAINRGLIVGPDVSTTFALTDTDNLLLAGTAAANTGDGILGSRFVQLTKASITKNLYAGGYLVTTDDTGEGYTYRVKGNDATGTEASGVVRIELYDKLQATVDTTTDITIIGNLYGDLISCLGGTDDVPSGVTCATTTATLIYSFVQTWGVAAIRMANAESAIPTAVGNLISFDAANGTAGSAVAWPVGAAIIGSDTVAKIGDVPPIGYILAIGDDTGHSAVYLTLAP